LAVEGTTSSVPGEVGVISARAHVGAKIISARSHCAAAGICAQGV
jgi:hypothetical protein